MRNIDAEIRKLHDKIEKLEKEKEELDLLTPEQRLAEVMHAKMCNWDHVEGCGWDYETWEKPGYARKSYINKAKQILKTVSLEDALLVVSYI